MKYVFPLVLCASVAVIFCRQTKDKITRLCGVGLLVMAAVFSECAAAGKTGVGLASAVLWLLSEAGSV